MHSFMHSFIQYYLWHKFQLRFFLFLYLVVKLLLGPRHIQLSVYIYIVAYPLGKYKSSVCARRNNT